MGVDWIESEGVMYHVDEEDGDVFAITPDGTATWLFDVPTAVGHPGAGGNGITYVPGGDGRDATLYVTDYYGSWNRDMVYEFTLTGTLVDSFYVGDFCPGVTGICYDGTYFWLASYGDVRVFKCDANMDTLASFTHPDYAPGGMDYDPITDTFYVTGFFSGLVYVCDGTMTVLESFDTGLPADGVFGVSIGRTYRDRSLWIADFADDFMYEIDDESETPVLPSSWGTIKNLFREPGPGE